VFFFVFFHFAVCFAGFEAFSTLAVAYSFSLYIVCTASSKNNNSPSALRLRVQLRLVLIVSAPFDCLAPLQLASGSFSLILASSRRGLRNTPQLASLIAAQLRRYLPKRLSSSFLSYFYYKLCC
jgi:hypothetical protein